MTRKIKTIEEINNKIAKGNVVVITADEMTEIVAELGPETAAEEIDVVTTGTFGAMCSSGVWLNFGHANPPIKLTKIWLNDVEAYSGVAAVDAYLGAARPSDTLGIEYGGGHIIEDLLRGKIIHVKAKGKGTDCYPRKELETEITLQDLNQAIMSNPRNCYERYNAATNSTERTLFTYMGKLLPNLENISYSGAGELSPINNDPTLQTIGVGTRIFLGGASGYIIGNGTQHNPEEHFSTLMTQGNLKEMSPEFIRGATITGYGSTLYVGIGVPIPIIDSTIAQCTAITNNQIITNILDYGVASRERPILRKANYAELKSGMVKINGNEVRTASISSFNGAKRIATLLKKKIERREFFLSQPVNPLPLKGDTLPMVQKEPQRIKPLTLEANELLPYGQIIYIDKKRCINCGLCLAYCPNLVFARNENWEIFVESNKCTACYKCQDVCPRRAIHHQSRGES